MELQQKITVKEILDLDQFKDLKDLWHELLRHCPSASAFQTWEWAFVWWNHFSQNKQLLILLSYDESQNLIGIAPLYIANKRIGAKKLRTVEFIGYGENKNSEYLNFIAPNNYFEEVIKTTYIHLYERKNEWDLLNLTNVPYDFYNKIATPNFVLSDKKYNLHFHQENNLGCPYIKLEFKDMDDYLKTIKPKQRGRLRNQRNKLLKNNNVEVILFQDHQKLKPAIDLLFDLHYKRFGENSVFYKKKNKSFILDICDVFYRNGILNLYFMKINGQYACTMLCFNFNNTLLFYQMGYDPKWLKHSALKILIFSVIERAIHDDIDEFDFGRGTEPYKLEWTDSVRRTDDILVFHSPYQASLLSLQKNFYSFFKKSFKMIFPQ